MADRRVKYTYDDGPFSEVGITGKQTSWRKNDSAFVPEADAALLISSGKFVDGTDFGSNDVHKQAHREIGGVPRQVAVSGVPFVILPGDGAAVGMFFTGTAGAFTLSAAIMTNAWNALKGCWCYLPANFGGKTYPAGWYWAVFSSDTAGILYKNTYSSGIPTRPSTLTPFADNLAGWLTQTTSEVTGPTGLTLRAGSMGPSGTLKSHSRMMGNVTANKTYKMYLDSTQVAFFGTLTTNPNVENIVSVRNQASESLQLLSHQLANPGVGQVAASFLSNEYSAIDTTTDKTLSYSLQISTNAACAILLHADATVTYGA
jgi:hypothetical protein